MNREDDNPVIGWWSGGVTSAVACKICIDFYGINNVRLVMIDTGNEDSDTYRFKSDCEKWYGVKIEVIKNEDYQNIQEVWRRNLSLNISKGAICSDRLKSVVRQRFQKNNPFSHQAFGFDVSEIHRAKAMKINHPNAKPIFPLITDLLSKKDCIKMVATAGIEIPNSYKLGFNNNNCLKTGCIQGGIGYWQKMSKEFPDKFNAMALMEHELTNKKGQPVTMLKDQSKDGGLVFLSPHPKYPLIKDLSMMKGRPSKPLVECNGFCGINDLSERTDTEKEINYSRLNP